MPQTRAYKLPVTVGAQILDFVEYAKNVLHMLENALDIIIIW